MLMSLSRMCLLSITYLGSSNSTRTKPKKSKGISFRFQILKFFTVLLHSKPITKTKSNRLIKSKILKMLDLSTVEVLL